MLPAGIRIPIATVGLAGRTVRVLQRPSATTQCSPRLACATSWGDRTASVRATGDTRFTSPRRVAPRAVGVTVPVVSSCGRERGCYGGYEVARWQAAILSPFSLRPLRGGEHRVLEGRLSLGGFISYDNWCYPGSLIFVFLVKRCCAEAWMGHRELDLRA